MGYSIEKQYSICPEAPIKDTEIRFQLSPELINKIKTISQIRPDWEKIQKQIDFFNGDLRNNKINDFNIYSLISEFHLKNCIELINENHFNIKFQGKTENFIFEETEAGRLNVVKRDKFGKKNKFTKNRRN